MRPETNLSILAALLAATVVSVGHADEDSPPTYLERSELAAETRGLAALSIENSRGDVQLSPSADGRIHLTVVKIVRMPTEAEARRLAARTSVQAGVVGGRYVVKVRYPERIEAHLNFWDLFSERGRRSFQFPSVQVRVVAQVPPGLPAEVNTVSGDVSSDGQAAPATLTTVSGEVTVRGSKAPVSVRTVSGDVGLEDTRVVRVHTTSGDVTAAGVGALDCETVSGDLEVTSPQDSLHYETSSGDANISEAPRGIRAHSVSGELAVGTSAGHVKLASQSGDIRVRLREPLTGAELGTVSGDVLVDFVPGTNAVLDASSSSGTIDCRAPAVLLKHDRNSLDARLGSGGPAVKIRSSSGNLTVMSGGK